MKRDELIVDGYNVIYGWDELKRLLDAEPGEAREKLEHWLTDFAAYKQCRLTIVYDAPRQGAEAKVHTAGSVTVVYTNGETADSYIERLSYERVRDGASVYVVTSDGAEQSVVLGVGAYRLPVSELVKRVRRYREKLRREFLVPRPNVIGRHDVSTRLDSATVAKLERLRRQDL